MICICVIVAFTGPLSALLAYSEHICQYLPHGPVEWRYLDTFLCVDGCR